MPSTLPIPDCFNIPIESLLWENKAITHIWIVEEDVMTPYNGLRWLLDMDADVSVIDYPLRNGFSTVVTSGKKILWCGTGCTMIKRKVLETIGFPYFRTDGCFWIDEDGTHVWKQGIKPSYGGHDIRFGIDVNNLGFRIQQAPVTAQHLELISRGETAVNNGTHTIRRHTLIRYHKDYPNFRVVGIDKIKPVRLG
jgi:hypothetical protein